MSTTVYEELCREINLFAKEHGLLVKYDPIDEEHPDEWGFTLYNQNRSWGYRRLFSAFTHELMRMDKHSFAEMVVGDIRKHLKEKGVIAY